MTGLNLPLLLPIPTEETLSIRLHILFLHLQRKAIKGTQYYLDNNPYPHSFIRSLIKVREEVRNREEATLRGSENTSHKIVIRNTIRQQACAIAHTTANVIYHIILLLRNVLLKVHFTRLLVLLVSKATNKFLTMFLLV